MDMVSLLLLLLQPSQPLAPSISPSCTGSNSGQRIEIRVIRIVIARGFGGFGGRLVDINNVVAIFRIARLDSHAEGSLVSRLHDRMM